MAYLPGVYHRIIPFDYTLFAGAPGDVADRNIGVPFGPNDQLLFATMHIGDFWDGLGISSADITIRFSGSGINGIVGGDAHIPHDNTIGNSFFPPGTILTQLIAHLDLSGGLIANLASGTCWAGVFYSTNG